MLTEDTKNVVQDFLDEKDDSVLTEVGASTVRVSKQTKRQQQAGAAALRLAKDANDPIYKKFIKYRTMMLDSKKKLMKKYGRKGMRAARQSMG